MGRVVIVLIMVTVMAVGMIVIVIMMIVMIVCAVEEFRLDFENTLQVEGVASEYRVERHRAVHGLVKFGIRVDRANSRLHFVEFIWPDEIGLVEDDHIGEGNLVLGFRRVFQPLGEPFGVGDGNDRIEPCCLAHIGVDEEGLRHGGGIGKAGRLDKDRVEFAPALQQALDDPDEIAAHGATNAAVVHFEHFLVGVDDQIIVDADFAKFIDDDGELPAMILGENAVQKRRLAGAEIAGEHGDGDFFGHT